MTALVTLLAGRNEIGDGEFGRTPARLQRQHFQPPTDAVIGIAEWQYRCTGWRA